MLFPVYCRVTSELPQPRQPGLSPNPVSGEGNYFTWAQISKNSLSFKIGIHDKDNTLIEKVLEFPKISLVLDDKNKTPKNSGPIIYAINNCLGEV